MHPVKKTPHMVSGIGAPLADSTPSSVQLTELSNGKAIGHSLDRGQYKELLDSKVFEEPRLGYRVFDDGEFAVYLSKIATGYQRGISTERIQVRYDPVLASLHAGNVRNVYYDRIGREGDAGFLKMIYNPEQVEVSQGIKEMLNGNVLSFSPSHEILFRPSVQHSEGYVADVIHKGQSIIARVKADGMIAPLIDERLCKNLIG